MILLHENFFGITTSNIASNFKFVAPINFGIFGAVPNPIYSRWSSNSSGVRIARAGSIEPGFLVTAIPESSTVYTGWAHFHEANDIVITFRQLGTVHVNVRFNSSGLISLQRGLSTTLATYTIPNYTNNTWYYCEFGAVISDISGSVEFRLNGQTVISASGLDTRNGANQWVDEVGFDAPTTAAACRITDWYVTNGQGSNPATNGFLGDIRIFSTIPSSSGDTLNFVPLSGTNVQMVDDGNSPDDNTTFVSASLSGSLDLYNTFQYTGSATQIYGVGVKTLARKTDAGSRNIRLTIKSGSNVESSVTQPVLDNYRYSSAVFETNPNTGTNWASMSDVNGTQIGYTIL